MALAGVLGYPVGHSRSPTMMGAAFRELGLDWRYVKLPVPPGLFAETVRALPASGYAGANVTIPHKLAARALADELSPAAEAIGAANTLSFADGRISADNTDAGGLIAALEEPVAGRRALVLGRRGRRPRRGVGAARGRAPRCRSGTAPRERAAALAAELGVGHAERPGPTDLLVNATSVGLVPDTRRGRGAGRARARPASRRPPPWWTSSTATRPRRSWRWASRGDGRVVGGLEVLVRQGALSLELWTGREAPVDAMRHAVSPAGL